MSYIIELENLLYDIFNFFYVLFKIGGLILKHLEHFINTRTMLSRVWDQYDSPQGPQKLGSLESQEIQNPLASITGISLLQLYIRNDFLIKF